MRGRRLGRYELLGEIGCGGMATVWLGRVSGPRGFERLVAIKQIHPHLLTDPKFVEMFHDEARIAACIRHPNVCSVFDFGDDDGTFYLAMDYLEGASLAVVQSALEARADELPASERHAFVVRIAIDAAEGLHGAHEARDRDGTPLEIVHRDVAPGNIFVRWDGVAQVLDFGCARARRRIFCSSFGAARGHVAYVAPEVLRGETPDRRADVWSLGVVLWETLTGQRLFKRGSIQETLYAVATDSVLPPSCVDVTIPRELDTIVLRALARDPAERWPNAHELGCALRRFLAQWRVGMDTPDVAAFMQRLFPDSRERAAHALATARETPLPILRPKVPVLDATTIGELFSALWSRPVLAAMVLGLLVGLGGTFVAMQLDGVMSASAAAAVPAPSPLEGVPRSIAVPAEDDPGSLASSDLGGSPESAPIPVDAEPPADQQRPQTPEQQSRSGGTHALPQAPQ